MAGSTDDRNEEEGTGDTPGVIAVRICALMLVVYALYFARSLTVPLATGTVLYLVLRPAVRYCIRLGIPSSVGAAGIMIALLLVVGICGYAIIEPAKETVSRAPQYLNTVKDKLSFITARLKAVDEATESIAETTDSDDRSEIEEAPVPVEIKQPAWVGNMSYLSGTGNVITFLTISGVLLYFLLAHGDDLLKRILKSLPDFTSRRRFLEVIQNVQEGLGSYLAQVTVINAGLGVAVGIAMWMLGMPSPMLWGVMAFAFNFIPIVGAIAGAVIILVVAMVTFEPTYYAFVVTLTFLALTSVEGQFVTPSILGRSMSMNPILVFLSISVWGWMWGIMGVFLSVPLLIATRMTCERYEGLTSLGMILGADLPEDADRSHSVAKATQADTTNAARPG